MRHGERSSGLPRLREKITVRQMPNRKTKQEMRAAKRQKAIAESERARAEAEQFDEDRLLKSAQDADARGEKLALPKMPVKTRKRVKLVAGFGLPPK